MPVRAWTPFLLIRSLFALDKGITDNLLYKTAG
jgi:hypothetical protein